MKALLCVFNENGQTWDKIRTQEVSKEMVHAAANEENVKKIERFWRWSISDDNGKPYIEINTLNPALFDKYENLSN